MAGGAKVIRFSGWRLDLVSRELWRSHSHSSSSPRIRLAEKPFLVLEELVRRPGEVVTRQELVAKLWPDGTTVDFDNNLNTAVAALREALQDSAHRPRAIETLPRLGYRLMTPRPARNLPRIARWSLTLALALGGVGIGAGFWLKAPPPPPEDSPAHRAFLRGAYYAGHETPQALNDALGAFRRAATLEPGYAAAHARVADVLSRMAFLHPSQMRERLHEARAAANVASSLDDELATPHRVRALAALHLDWDFGSARRELERALALAADDAFVHLTFATYCSALGRHDEAIAAARRAAALDPASLLVRSDLGFFYLAAGRYEEAIASSRESLALEPEFVPALRVLMAAAERLDRYEDAAGAALAVFRLAGEPTAELERESPRAIVGRFHAWDLERIESRGGRISPLARALKYAAVSNSERALDLLEESFEQREGFLVFLTGFAELSELHSHPRFRAIARRMGLLSKSA